MVKIAIAGATSQLAREIIDYLASTKKHEIIALVRTDPAQFPALPGVEWVQTTYQDKSELVRVLKGVHTVLCFFTAHLDVGSESQKRLIDAAVEAGVKRYAASEWGIGVELESATDVMPWYTGKVEVRDYLKKINQEKKVLEYTLFQPGTFLNYLGYPHQTTNHILLSPQQFNFEDLHVVTVEGHQDDHLVFTTIEDICKVVGRAIEYEGEWPTIGGIRGSRVTIADLLRIGEAVRGKPITVDYLKEEDLRAGIIKTDKYTRVNHPSVPKDQVEAFSKMGLIGISLGIVEGAYDVSDEWNKLLPDFEFVQVEDFMKKVWTGK